MRAGVQVGSNGPFHRQRNKSPLELGGTQIVNARSDRRPLASNHRFVGQNSHCQTATPHQHFVVA